MVCVDEPSYLPGDVRPGPAVTPEDPPLAPATGTGLGEAAVSAAAVSSSEFIMARMCREGQGRVSGMRPEERQHMLSDEVASQVRSNRGGKGQPVSQTQEVTNQEGRRLSPRHTQWDPCYKCGAEGALAPCQC